MSTVLNQHPRKSGRAPSFLVMQSGLTLQFTCYFNHSCLLLIICIAIAVYHALIAVLVHY